MAGARTLLQKAPQYPPNELDGEHHADEGCSEQAHAQRLGAHDVQLLQRVAPVDLACGAEWGKGGEQSKRGDLLQRLTEPHLRATGAPHQRGAEWYRPSPANSQSLQTSWAPSLRIAGPLPPHSYHSYALVPHSASPTYSVRGGLRGGLCAYSSLTTTMWPPSYASAVSASSMTQKMAPKPVTWPIFPTHTNHLLSLPQPPDLQLP